jgi:hypothetical protein
MATLSPELIAELVNRIVPATGPWSKFNSDIHYYAFLVTLANTGVIDYSDLPPIPDPVNYGP